MRYKVQDEKGNIFETKDTIEKFQVGDEVYMDARENLYHGDLRGGVPYGNPTKILPTTVEIKDSGTVEWIEDIDLFSSFKFNGKLLKGYWVMRRESPDSEIWVFSKGRLPGEKLKEDLYFSSQSEIPEFFEINETLPSMEIHYNGNVYLVNSTKNKKLIMTKSEG